MRETNKNRFVFRPTDCQGANTDDLIPNRMVRSGYIMYVTQPLHRHSRPEDSARRKGEKLSCYVAEERTQRYLYDLFIT